MHDMHVDARNARLGCLRDYLSAKAPAGRLPGRQHIDPCDIPDLLPYLMLLEVVPQPNSGVRYRVRLAGTHVVDLLGRDATGKFFDQIVASECSDEIAASYADAIRTKQPQRRDGALSATGREHILYERVAFPLARDGENVDMLLLLMVGTGSTGRKNEPIFGGQDAGLGSFSRMRR